MAKKKPSVQERILQRMRAFTESLENNEIISERFVCRKFIRDPMTGRITEVKNADDRRQ